MYAFIFPGQGSQAVGMGYEVYQAFPKAREVFEEVDDVLHQNLTRLIFEGPQEELTQTVNAQPALMAVSLALLRAFEEESVWRNVKYVAGHSLGEYSALTAADSLSIPEAAKLLRVRGQAMQQAVPSGQGTMAAILGLELDVVKTITQEAAQHEVCTLANDNAPGQIIISGHKAAVERAIKLAQEKGSKKCLLLPVSGPFHCTLMEPAAHTMTDALAIVPLQKPKVPLISNVTAEPETTPQKIKDLLIQQVTGQVRWREIILHLSKIGIKTVIEVGAGKVLTGLTKRITPELNAFALNTPQDIEEFMKTAA